MPREKDPFRSYVMPPNENNGKWRCVFCGLEHGGGATRIKAHLAGIAGFGIKGCEKVSDIVRADAKDALMAKKVFDSSNQGVSEEMIQGNVGAVPTSTSNLPNVVGGIFSQFPQGLPPLTQQTHGGFKEMMQEERAVDSANIPLDGATRALLIPEKVDSRDQGVCEENIQGNVGAAPTSTSHSPNVEERTSLQFPQGMLKVAPPAGASPQYDRTTVPHSNERLPSCNEECGTESSSFSLRESMDIYPLTATHVDLQVLGGGPSSLQVKPALVSPQHQSDPHQSINHETRNAQQNPAALSSTCLPTALMDMDPCISSSQAPNDAPPPPQIPPCGLGPIGASSSPELNINEGAPTTSHPNISNNFEEYRALKGKLKLLYSREADIRNQVEFAASLSLQKLRMEAVNWLADVEELRNYFHSIEVAIEDCLAPDQYLNILMQAEGLIRQSKVLNLFETRETKVSKLLEENLVGKAFQRNTTKIMEYLVGNEVSRLGIYGMGGVGKTSIMVHVHNKLLEKAAYGHVLWITVSQDFNTRRLQDDIWRALSLGKLQEKDVRKRAAMLSNCLIERGKFIIILDDVWERLDLEEVGIPSKADAIKLVLTTRSFKVCCQMHCQEKIKIEPLSQKEAECLFMEELGSEVTLDLETKAVIKSIVNECAGLPIGVITMARSMREATDAFEWRDSLVKLKESSMGQTDMEEKVLMNLQFSYDRLGNHDVQQCFLSCALYPEDELIDEFELVEFFIDQGLIGGLSTRKEQYDRGLTILNKLGNVCLLEAQRSGMKMHDLIRDMALHIMSVTSIVKAGRRLTMIPPEEYWMDALEKVSLKKNNIRGFPLNMSPNCPKLSTLLLDYGFSHDAVIPDSFFKKLWGLKVLNLSGYNMTELPNSISDLVNLRALLLRECRKLRHIPYLGKLTSLRKLDASGCESLEALEGPEKLVNLRYLDLTKTRIERLPKGTLDCLLYLQCLKVWAVNEEDITKLGALETFRCYPENADDFNKCVRVIEQSNNPRYYKLNVGLEESEFIVEVSDDARFGNLGRSVYIGEWGHAIVSVGGECAGIFILIPRDVLTLIGIKCDGITNLSGMGLLEYLEELEIDRWEHLGVLCGGQDEEVINIHDSPSPLLFPNLRVLQINECPKLKYLFGHGSNFRLPHLRSISIRNCKEMVGITSAVTSPPPYLPPAFPSLTKLLVQHCHGIKRVVESKWLPHFHSLRRITVKHCKNMEEIIGGFPPYMPVEELLIHLQNLRSIYISCCIGMVKMIRGPGQSQEGSIMTPVNNTPSTFQSSISLPKLKRMKLSNLPQLKSICEVPIICDSMEDIVVDKCPGLKEIPLQLQLGDIEELPHVWVEDEEKWKTLRWNHPNAQAILQPHLHLCGSTRILVGRRSH